MKHLGTLKVSCCHPLDLYYAANTGDLKAWRDLLAAGVDINIPINEDKGTTALMVAAAAGHAEMVQEFLAEGADVNAADYRGQTALHKAAKKCQTHVFEALAAVGADLDAGAVAGNGEFAMMPATGYGCTATVQMLIAAGANVNVAEACHGITPLMLAASKGHTAIVQALVAAGAELEATDSTTGSTALYMAAYRGHTAAVQALAAAGANLNAYDNNGHTALGAAAWLGHAETLGALLAAGADVDDLHVSSLVLLDKKGHKQIVKMLLQAYSTEKLQTWLTWAAALGEFAEQTCTWLIKELGARDQAAAAITKLLQQEPYTAPVLTRAMLEAWSESTSEVDAQLAAAAEEQQQLAAGACSAQDLLLQLAAQDKAQHTTATAACSNLAQDPGPVD